MNEIVKKNILGVAVSNASESDVLEYIIKSVEKKVDSYYIVTPNPEIIVYATKHKTFQSILNQARISLCDGIGLKIAAQFLGKDVKEKITGVDLLEKLCNEVARKPITVGFLGGRGGVAELAAECLQKKYPGLQVVFAAEEWEEGFDKARKIDLLFVAFGFPKQEQWIHDHVGKVPVHVMMGVGGTFDYLAGKVPRAPRVMQQMGLEWLFRLVVQPWRIRRQLALIEFIFLVLKAKLIKQVS